MSDPTNKEQEALDRLAAALAEDVLNTSDDELLKDAKAEGRDIATAGSRGRTIFARAVKAEGKRRLMAARAAVDAKQVGRLSTRAAAISDSQARRMVDAALQDSETKAKLTMALRKGQLLRTRGEGGQPMSDGDIRGILEDLDELGLLSVDDPGEP